MAAHQSLLILLLQIEIPVLLLLQEALNAAKDLFRSHRNDVAVAEAATASPPPYTGSRTE